MSAITLTSRELSTVLAALRYWQNDLDDPTVAGDLMDVASNGGVHVPLSASEVEDLCEKLNT